VGALVSLRLAGPQTLARFSSTFADEEVRDESANSRIDLWQDCVELMLREPLFGVGPEHFPYYAQYHLGWGAPKEAHSLWFQTGAELGFVGVGLLLAFYLICIRRLWPITKRSAESIDPRLANTARMVIASLAGFFVSSQFVSLEGLELPYYVVLVGVGVIKVAYQPATLLVPNSSSASLPQHPGPVPSYTH
jgi:O-antigen ligase